MIGIVIVAHGGLAQEYLAAVEHVVGPLPGTAAIRIEPELDRAAKATEIIDAANAVDDGDGVVVVVDLFGGTPANLSLPACAVRNRAILYGANLPMLVKLAKSRQLPLPEAVAFAKEAGRKYINSYNVPESSGAAETTHP
ncbi:PTS sugar transporter subunit IIA [Paracoccus sp. (in: a-proteobacteria)]|uniref:PTS sugar transporter subunit IIA n=1 Tax=Paracoccus sp. TaxID=267 RepID=UPI0026DFA725|nr:PTS fructose transporter subunit IIA [Paracoccus sp. (in: a-proteobacteria)]MDO5647138.1 PTS fructose transporter subunit IIA [Paracoccus sp. (in: a-proteobacteria)]